MELVKIICDGTMKAAGLIAGEKRLQPDLDKLVESLKVEVKAGYPEVLSELKSANEEHMPESMLREIINVNCNLIAVRALRAAGCEI